VGNESTEITTCLVIKLKKSADIKLNIVIDFQQDAANRVYFSSFFALHVLGATFTHHQEPQLYKLVWCNCINRLCGWTKCVSDPDQLYGRCESEMSPVNVSEPD
jgi:hypothetical protein